MTKTNVTSHSHSISIHLVDNNIRGKRVKMGRIMGWLDSLISVGLLLGAFILCAYGVNGVIQGSILGALSLTLGIVCVGLSCMGPVRLKEYIKG
jgi:hypothetical protein